MSEIELRLTYWKQRAAELFLNDFENPKDFYENYTSPVDVYYTLAKRAIWNNYDGDEPDEAAYQMMYSAYMQDAANNDFTQLEALIELNNPPKSQSTDL